MANFVIKWLLNNICEWRIHLQVLSLNCNLRRGNLRLKGRCAIIYSFFQHEWYWCQCRFIANWRTLCRWFVRHIYHIYSVYNYISYVSCWKTKFVWWKPYRYKWLYSIFHANSMQIGTTQYIVTYYLKIDPHWKNKHVKRLPRLLP